MLLEYIFAMQKFEDAVKKLKPNLTLNTLSEKKLSMKSPKSLVKEARKC